MSLTERTKAHALAHGADLAGVVAASALPEHTESVQRILPDARSASSVTRISAGWWP